MYRASVSRNELQDLFNRFDLTDPYCAQIVKIISDLPFLDEERKMYIIHSSLPNRKELKGKIKNYLDKELNFKNSKDLSENLVDLITFNDDLIVPSALLHSINSGRPLALFTGAGVSKLLGVPLWNELAKKAIYFLSKKGKIKYLEERYLSERIGNPKEIISIFHHFMKDEPKLLYEFYDKSLNLAIDEKKDGFINPYDLLVGFDGIHVTTNLEYYYAKSMAKKINDRNLNVQDEGSFLYSELRLDSKQLVVSVPDDQIDFNNISKEKIYHLHGSLLNLDSAILTTKQYAKEYFGREGQISSFIEYLFNNYTVLFLGYGLAEYQILEGVLRVSDKHNHHALIHSCSTEQGEFRLKKRYLSDFGITAHEYYLDIDGYNRFNKVLNSWLSKLREIDSVEKAKNLLSRRRKHRQALS